MPGSRHNDLLIGVERLASEAAEACGVELVEVQVKGSGSRRRVRVDIDRMGPLGVNLDDCKKVSTQLGLALDETDLIPSDGYVLEVSSPGLDRPIETDDDIRRNTGRQVRVELAEPVDGNRVHGGILLGLEQGRIRLRGVDGSESELPLEQVVKATQDPGF